MDFLTFVDFALAWDERGSPAGMRWLFRVFDVQGRGHLTQVSGLSSIRYNLMSLKTWDFLLWRTYQGMRLVNVWKRMELQKAKQVHCVAWSHWLGVLWCVAHVM